MALESRLLAEILHSYWTLKGILTEKLLLYLFLREEDLRISC